MKMPTSLIDKKIKVLNGPIVAGRIKPECLERVEVNYLEYELSAISERYKKSHTVKHLVGIIDALKQDVIALRAHVEWQNEQTEEAV